VNESSCRFGPGGRLVGIVTEPHNAPPPRRAACVLVNAGLVPKFGPFRLYARLARRLADEGLLTLRFDLGGIGDSRPGHAGRPLRERTMLELGDAVDHVAERYAPDGVILGGLCSGAEDSFRYAEGDPRVAGVVLIDPFGYRTAGWYWRHLRHRLARRSLRALGVYEPFAAPAAAPKGESLVNYQHMDRAESGRILGALLGRRARVHFVYTGGMIEYFNHRRQLAAMFRGVDFRGLVTLDHFPHIDHTPALEEDRRALVEAIGARLAAACRVPPAPGLRAP
jgi:dienelactone hydrolase